MDTSYRFGVPSISETVSWINTLVALLGDLLLSRISLGNLNSESSLLSLLSLDTLLKLLSESFLASLISTSDSEDS